jgi:uncharacterized protein (DUF433 family)
VVGGDACIVRTRIPVWALENYRRLGWSEAQILENYPPLRAVALVNAWAYVDAHRKEIDRAIHENEGEIERQHRQLDRLIASLGTASNEEFDAILEEGELDESGAGVGSELQTRIEAKIAAARHN